MSSPIIFIRVLPFDSNTVVWHTKSTVNKHTFFCENEDCGNETHCDTLCDSCRASLVALFVGGAENEHKCSPIRVDNGHVEYYDCDDVDSPSCPQNRKRCADCHSSIHKEEEDYDNGDSYHGSCWFDRQQ